MSAIDDSADAGFEFPDPAPYPVPVMGLFDRPFWRSVLAQRTSLQKCDDCGAFRYPPGPCCPECLSPQATWTQLLGGGTILSWVVFHRQYLPAYPAPHAVVAVRLDEGPVMMSNLEGEWPKNSWIGRRVRLVHHEIPGGFVLPRFQLVDDERSAEI